MSLCCSSVCVWLWILLNRISNSSSSYCNIVITTLLFSLLSDGHKYWFHSSYNFCIATKISCSDGSLINIVVAAVFILCLSRSGLVMTPGNKGGDLSWNELTHNTTVRERSSTVVSARWATVDWSWRVEEPLSPLKKYKAQMGTDSSNLLPKSSQVEWPKTENVR